MLRDETEKRLRACIDKKVDALFLCCSSTQSFPENGAYRHIIEVSGDLSKRLTSCAAAYLEEMRPWHAKEVAAIAFPCQSSEDNDQKERQE